MTKAWVMFFSVLAETFSAINNFASAANKASQVVDEMAGDYLEIQQHEQKLARLERKAQRDSAKSTES